MKELLEKVEQKYNIKVKFVLGLSPLPDEAIEIISYYNHDFEDSFLTTIETDISYIRIIAIDKKTRKKEEFYQNSADYMEAFDKEEIKLFLKRLIN